MFDLPDAPWVRDAENNGMPSAEPVLCPVCGEECETLFEDSNGEIFGCDQCVTQKDAWEWAEEKRLGEEEDGWHDER